MLSRVWGVWLWAPRSAWFAGAIGVVFLWGSTALGQAPAVEPAAAAPPPAAAAPLDLPLNHSPAHARPFRTRSARGDGADRARTDRTRTRRVSCRSQPESTTRATTKPVCLKARAAPVEFRRRLVAVPGGFHAHQLLDVRSRRQLSQTSWRAQVGGYFFDHLRVSARLVAPLEAVTDNHSSFGDSAAVNGASSFSQQSARNVSVLYAATVGFAVSNEKSFVFGPSVALFRTDVEAYGSAVAFVLPFEWVTTRNLRVGFEFDLGHAFGGSVRDICRTSSPFSTSCGSTTVERGSGSMIVAQFNMGWSLGKL